MTAGAGSNQYHRRPPAGTGTPQASLVTQLAGTARQRAMATSQMSSAGQLAAAARDPSAKVRYRVARHPAATPAILHQLSADPDPEVQHAVAAHPALTSDDGELLASTVGISRALVRLAKRSNITDQAVQHIVSHLGQHWATLQQQPDSGQLDPGSRSRLSSDVVAQLSRNTHLSEHGLQLLLDLASWHPRQTGNIIKGLVDTEHPAMTGRQQHQLVTMVAQAYNPAGWDYRRCQWRQPLPAPDIEDLFRNRRVASLLHNPSISWDQALRLASERGQPTENETLALMVRPDCSSEFLRSQASRTSEMVVHKLASHRNCPPDVLGQLASHHSAMVRTNVAERCRDPQVLQRLADDPTSFVRQNVAANQHTPAGTLAELLQDHDSLVSSNASNNPALPRYLRAIWQLTTDRR
jgi:hypothetical protein